MTSASFGGISADIRLPSMQTFFALSSSCIVLPYVTSSDASTRRNRFSSLLVRTVDRKLTNSVAMTE